VGDCNVYNYGGGRWSSYPDLKAKVQAHFQVSAHPVRTVPVLQPAPPVVSPARPVPAPTPYRLITASNKCLGVEGGNPNPGARIIEWDCIDKPDQYFTFMSDGSVRTFNGLCLDERTGMGRQMDQIESWSCNATRGQKSQLQNYSLRSAFTGMCVDIRGGVYLGNRDAILYSCNGQPNQRYRWATDVRARAGERTVVTGGGQVPDGGLIMPRAGAASGVIAAGAGNVVAAGSGNVIAAGGANLIAAGGANVIAVGGANVIAAGGAN
jgi:hypothetical protein